MFPMISKTVREHNRNGTDYGLSLSKFLGKLLEIETAIYRINKFGTRSLTPYLCIINTLYWEEGQCMLSYSSKRRV